MIRLWSILLFAALSGCTQYEFNLTEPADVAQHIGHKEPITLTREPVRYQLQAYESRLVLIVRNPTDSAIEFLGDQSYVVDPNGQSHPFPNQTIAANSFIKLILPPLLPAYRTEPGFGVGVGFGVSQVDPYGPSGSDPIHSWSDPYDYREPLYFSLADSNTNHYWSWNKESAIRLRLTYRHNNDTLKQDFVFQRVKA
ncbi:MAG: hypothetical protein ACM359_07190 [Bacillota bacterium]